MTSALQQWEFYLDTLLKRYQKKKNHCNRTQTGTLQLEKLLYISMLMKYVSYLWWIWIHKYVFKNWTFSLWILDVKIRFQTGIWEIYSLTVWDHSMHWIFTQKICENIQVCQPENNWSRSLCPGNQGVTGTATHKLKCFCPTINREPYEVPFCVILSYIYILWK